MRNQKGFTLIEIMIVILVIGILLTIAIPNFVRAKRGTCTKACVTNMQKIDCVKTEWAMENGFAGTSVPAADELVPYLMSTMLPVCPEGADPYVMAAVDEKTACPNVGVYVDHVQQ